jgi:lysophospholipase L1-like esterase
VRLTAYGHSWIDGDGASERARTLVALVAQALGLEADNRGVGGSHSPETAALVRARPPEPSALLLLMTGLNDARLHGDDPAALAEYGAAVDAILAELRTACPDAVVVAIEQPHLVDYSLHAPHDQGSDALVDAYNATLGQVAGAHPGTLLVRVTGWDARTMLADDTVHPNDAGHAQIARAVVDAVGDTVRDATRGA